MLPVNFVDECNTTQDVCWQPYFCTSILGVRRHAPNYFRCQIAPRLVTAYPQTGSLYLSNATSVALKTPFKIANVQP